MPATARAPIEHHADAGEADRAVTVPVDAVARSEALLTAAGFSLIPLATPVAGVWDLLAVSPRGLI